MSERLRRVARLRGMDHRELVEVFGTGGLGPGVADLMVENALGQLGMPIGLGLNFRVNARNYVVPMAVEEPSVIAAASHAAKRALAGGGFFAESTEPLMAAQVQLEDVVDATRATAIILRARTRLLEEANRAMPSPVLALGGGAKDLQVRDLGEGMLVVHFIVDCRDAMGANMVNTLAEAMGPRLAELVGARCGLRILSNYCDLRRTVVRADIPILALADSAYSGSEAARGIASASRFAELDPYRAVTHNKGIMNGVDAVVLATGNDWRAVEAAAHAFAARAGRYAPLATWKLSKDGTTLSGELELPLALGTVGGALRVHDGARLALRLLGVETATELANVVAAVGLATNLSALRALATEGIQRCHMALHERAAEPARLGAA